jgi:hypothetical protein
MTVGGHEIKKLVDFSPVLGDSSVVVRFAIKLASFYVKFKSGAARVLIEKRSMVLVICVEHLYVHLYRFLGRGKRDKMSYTNSTRVEGLYNSFELVSIRSYAVEKIISVWRKHKYSFGL